MKKIITVFALSILLGLANAQDHSSYYSKPYQKKALEIFRTSIGFHTAKSHGQVPAMAEYLANEYRAGEIVLRCPGALVCHPARVGRTLEISDV